MSDFLEFIGISKMLNHPRSQKLTAKVANWFGKNERRHLHTSQALVQVLESRALLSANSIGSEFQINTTTAGAQADGQVAMNAKGGFVVTWNTNWHGIYAQPYSASGSKIGGEIHVNTTVTSLLRESSVAIDGTGNFVVVWMSLGQDASGTKGIFGQRFDAAGTPVGGEFQVNTYTAGDQYTPKVAMDSAGDFVVTWVSKGQDGDGEGIYAQRFDAQGVAQGTEFRVNSSPDFNQDMPSIAMNQGGSFVIGWLTETSIGSIDRLNFMAQSYDSSGSPQGNNFVVNSILEGWEHGTSVAMDAAGDMVFGWIQNDYELGVITASSALFGRRFSANGVPLEQQFLVNKDTERTFDYDVASVSMDANGNFVFSWMSLDNDFEINARRYNLSGNPLGDEFRVNSTIQHQQMVSSVAMDAGGDFVVVWQSDLQDNTSGGDGSAGSHWGIYGQLFANPSDYVGARRGSTFYLDSDHSDRFENATSDFAGAFGNSTDLTITGDWNGDGFDEIGIWRNGSFYLDANGNGKWDGAATDSYFKYGSFGAAGDLPLAGDWNGDGKTEIGVWSQGKFYLDLNGNHVQDAGDGVYAFGASNDTPLIGDWNGDGVDDVGTWRAGRFYLDYDGNHKWNAAVDKVFAFGAATDIPVTGDWNGDQKDEIGIRRGNTFWLDNNGNGAWSGTASGADQQIRFGNAGDVPLVGYWKPKAVASPSSALSLQIADASLVQNSGVAQVDRRELPASMMAQAQDERAVSQRKTTKTDANSQGAKPEKSKVTPKKDHHRGRSS